MTNNHDPLVPWTNIGGYIIGPRGKPVSAMTLWRWRKKGVIRVVSIGGRNYVRLNETLKRIGFVDEGSEPGAAA
jgi:hypothetical protein